MLDLTPKHAISSSSALPPNTTHTLVLGRIHRAHIRNSVLSDDGLTVDTAALRAVSRLGGMAYARIGDSFDLERPSWRKEEGTIRDFVAKRNTTEKL